MEVVEDTGNTFHIASQPSIVSQAVFSGFFAFGFSLSFYSDSVFWQLLYILGSFIIASSFLGQWQKLVVDRVSRKLHYDVQNIYQKIFAKDKFLVSETLDLNQMKQIKSNVNNGTISFYHNLSTINVYIGNPDLCEAMLAKFKSILPTTPVPQSEVPRSEESSKDREDRDSNVSDDGLDDAERDDGTEVHESNQELSVEREDHQEEEVEPKASVDVPKAPGLDKVKEEDDGLSSDDSFVKIDGQEVGDDVDNFRDPTPTEVKFICGDREAPTCEGTEVGEPLAKTEE